MKKRSLLLIAVLMAGLLSVPSIPAYAKPHITVEGTWDYQGQPWLDERWAGDNYFIRFADCGTWTGGLR